MLRRISIVFFSLLFFASILEAAAPTFSSTSGTLSNGNTITVSGANYGTARTSDYYQYFDDYTSDWSCNGPGCSTFPSSGSNFTGDTDLLHTYYSGENTYMGQFGDPLMIFNDTYSNFSTGRSVGLNIEYYTGGAGALPNSFFYMALAQSDEFWIVYHVYHDAAWSGWSSFYIEKNSEIWATYSGSAHKASPRIFIYSANLRWDAETFSEVGGDYNTVDEPDANANWTGAGKWHEFKIHLKKQTTGNTDGVVQLYVNGAIAINDTTAKIIDDGSSYFDRSDNYQFSLGGNIQLGASQQFLNGVGNEWVRMYDDVFVEESATDPTGGVFPSVACVYISDQSTWGSGPTDKLNGDANFIRQKVGGITSGSDLGYMSWSDTGFKFEYQDGSLSGPLYLYVWSWSGEYNSTGYSLSGDTTPPTVTAFVIPSTSQSLTVPISTFTATDAVGVTGYCVNESATPPTSGSCSGSGWGGSAQTSYVFASEGSKTLYAWAKDAAGNISDSLNDGVTITLPTASLTISSGSDLSIGSGSALTWSAGQ